MTKNFDELNDTFNVSGEIVPTTSSEVSVFVNGQLQTPPGLTTFQDYSVTGSNVYFTTGSTPDSDSLILAIYNKSA